VSRIKVQEITRFIRFYMRDI